MQSEVGDDLVAQVRRAWLLAFGRVADDVIVASSVAFLEKQHQNFLPPETGAAAPAAASPANPPPLTPNRQALALLCQALLSSNPFLYVE